MGKEENSRVVYMIDFGLSKKFKTSKNQHIPYATGKSLTGTARYASCNVHNGIGECVFAFSSFVVVAFPKFDNYRL